MSQNKQQQAYDEPVIATAVPVGGPYQQPTVVHGNVVGVGGASAPPYAQPQYQQQQQYQQHHGSQQQQQQQQYNGYSAYPGVGVVAGSVAVCRGCGINFNRRPGVTENQGGFYKCERCCGVSVEREIANSLCVMM